MNIQKLLKQSKKTIAKWSKQAAKYKKKLPQVPNLAEQHEKKVVTSLSDKRIPRLSQFKYSVRVLSPQERSIVKRLMIAWVVVMVAFTTSMVMNRTQYVAAQGGTYSEGLIGTPQFLNPVLAFSNDTDVHINRLLFSGLLRFDEQLQLQPDLAHEFSINDEQTAYTFTLRSDVFWHDGEPITVDDVIFTFETIQNPQFNSPHFGKFQSVTIKKLNEQTVQFVLESPFSGFLPNFTLGIIPEHIWGTIPPANSRLAEANLKPVGSGPFQFEKLEKDKNGTLFSYGLKRYDNYHGQMPYLDQVTFKFYNDLATGADALAKQNVDGLEYLPAEQRETLTTAQEIAYHTFSLPQYTAIFFNHTQNEQLEHIDVRKALAHAIDKQRIVADIFQNEAQVIDGPLLPGLVGYSDEITRYDYSLDEARSLLANAGWSVPEGEAFLKKGDAVLTIRLTTVDLADTIATVEHIKKTWTELGVQVQLEIIPRQSIERDSISPRNYEALLFGQIFGADQDPFPFWHSSRRQSPGVNLTHFTNKQADSLLEQGRVTIDAAERMTMYKDFQDIIIREVPAIFLYSPIYTYPIHTNVRGITQTNINSPADRFNGISSWFVKSKRTWAK